MKPVDAVASTHLARLLVILSASPATAAMEICSKEQKINFLQTKPPKKKEMNGARSPGFLVIASRRSLADAFSHVGGAGFDCCVRRSEPRHRTASGLL